MPKPKSIGIDLESTSIQRPHLNTFVTFIVSIVSMTSKLTFIYIRATVLALHLSALTMLSEEKQQSAATFYTKILVISFYYGSPVAPNNG